MHLAHGRGDRKFVRTPSRLQQVADHLAENDRIKIIERIKERSDELMGPGEAAAKRRVIEEIRKLLIAVLGGCQQQLEREIDKAANQHGVPQGSEPRLECGEAGGPFLRRDRAGDEGLGFVR